MQIQQNINKLLDAIRMRGLDIKYDAIQFYSINIEKYCTKYVIYIKSIKEEKGKIVEKYRKQEEYYSKVDLLKYLAEKYKEIDNRRENILKNIKTKEKEGEANG